MDVSLQQMDEYARAFVERLPKERGARAYVVGLKGDLGAGKTTFVQHTARALGVKETVTSPTFVLVQRYGTKHPLFTHLVHVDAYRLKGEEKDTVGFNDALSDPSNLLLVEWPEHLPHEANVPSDAPLLIFETLDETHRRISSQ